MKINKVIAQLNAIKKQHGNIEVMFQSPNSDNGPFAVEKIELEEVEEDEYPEDFNMPAGFKFVSLGN